MSRCILIATVFCLVQSPPVEAANDIYSCRQRDGREFMTNTPAQYRSQGAKCRLMMKGISASSSEAKPSSKSSKSSKKKRNSTYKPRAKRSSAPRVVAEPSSAKDRYALYAPYVREAAETYMLPQAFIRAVMRVESAFRYKAVSSAGAQGLMQLMPGTAREMGVHDSFDPRQNIMGGSKLLRLLANRFDGDFAKVLSAYHAGSGAVKAKGGIPYKATEGYVQAVMDHYYRYKEAPPS